jgi:methylmalonyl-CoA epimerase
VPGEQVNTAFLPLGETHLELLESLSPQGPIGRSLEKRGEGVHHLCFLVDDLEVALARCRRAGMTVLGEPRAGAHNKRVVFLHPASAHGVLIEPARSRGRRAPGEQMKLSPRERREEPLLVDRAADYFGSAGRVCVVRPALRTDGSLVLTEDRLIFSEHELGTTVEIPLAEIRNIGMGRWHEPTGSFLPVLKITYQENLILGVHVSRPDRWAAAIEDLIAQGRLPRLRGNPRRAQLVPRGSGSWWPLSPLARPGALPGDLRLAA